MGTEWGNQGFFYALMYENESLLESEVYAADPDLESPATMKYGFKNIDYDKEAVDWIQYESAYPIFRWSFWTSTRGILILIATLVILSYLWKRYKTQAVSVVKSATKTIGL